MTEFAYSLEEHKNISARVAHKKSLSKELNSATEFKCSDEECCAPLTCTNWGKVGQRIYFRLSSNSNPHDVGCSQASDREKQTFIVDEYRLFKHIIEKTQTIKMVKSYSTKNKKNSEHESNKQLNNNRGNIKTNKISRTNKESHTSKILETFIDLLMDETIDKDKKIVSINNESLSLHELFVPIEKLDESLKKVRIYFGQARIKTANFGTGMAEIEFIGADKRFKKVYSNIQSLKKGVFTKLISQVIDKDKTVTIYFRSQVVNDDQNKIKLKSFNKKIYQDLSIHN